MIRIIAALFFFANGVLTLENTNASSLQADTTMIFETTGTTSKTTSTSDIITETTTLTCDPSEYDYEGFIYAAQHDYTFMVGDSTFTDKFFSCLQVKALLPDDSGMGLHVGPRFRLGSETYAECYTYDLSEVDINTPRTYTVYVYTNEGVIDTFSDYHSKDYRIKMVEHQSSFTVKIEENISRPLFGNPDLIHNVAIGQHCNVLHARTKDDDTVYYNCEPEGIIEIKEEDLCDEDDYRYIYFDCLKEGFVTLTATAENGMSTSCKFKVFASEDELEEYNEQIATTTVYSETVSFETSTTSSDSAHTNDISTLTGSTETTVWADYTSAATSETTATSDSDLPQTGRNTLNQIAVVFGALMMLCTGAWAVRSTGVIRRKDDEA